MKTKIVVMVTAAVLVIVAAAHIGHKPPADGKCPLQSVLTAGK